MASDCYCPKCERNFKDPWYLFGANSDPHKDEAAPAHCDWCGADFYIERIVTVEYRTKTS